MSYEVFFTELADADIDGIIDYIAKDNPHNALQFVSRLQERIQNTLGTAPLTGSSYGGARFFAFDNYVVVYDIDEKNKSVYVHLVSEGHRQWRAILTDRF